MGVKVRNQRQGFSLLTAGPHGPLRRWYQLAYSAICRQAWCGAEAWANLRPPQGPNFRMKPLTPGMSSPSQYPVNPKLRMAVSPPAASANSCTSSISFSRFVMLVAQQG